MDKRTITISCEVCDGSHRIEIDFHSLTESQKNGIEPVLSNFICPDAARMYRVVNFCLDTRVSILQNLPSGQHSMIIDVLRNQWGEHEFDHKLSRYIELNAPLFGIPDEYYELINSIISAYCCSLYYPAITSCGALGERILNRLLLKTRKYYSHAEHYKKVCRKDSFDNWDYVISTLNDWGVIDESVARNFGVLKKYRNDSIHYNEGYDFKTNCKEAISCIIGIVNLQFNCMNRKDLFWVFDVPGEIWLKTECENLPFVKEFVIPHCVRLTPKCEPFANPQIRGRGVPRKPLSDIEFINARKKSIAENATHIVTQIKKE